KDNQNIPPNPFIIIALLAAIAGIIVQLMRNIRKKYQSSDTDIEYSPLKEPKDKKDNQNIPPNPFIIIALLAAIAGIIVQLMRNIR
ncbi:hypothetical protein BOQ64_23110, partial [Chryseobacterium sp. CH25]